MNVTNIYIKAIKNSHLKFFYCNRLPIFKQNYRAVWRRRRRRRRRFIILIIYHNFSIVCSMNRISMSNFLTVCVKYWKEKMRAKEESERERKKHFILAQMKVRVLKVAGTLLKGREVFFSMQFHVLKFSEATSGAGCRYFNQLPSLSARIICCVISTCWKPTTLQNSENSFFFSKLKSEKKSIIAMKDNSQMFSNFHFLLFLKRDIET
jgi:hypothetical protein